MELRAFGRTGLLPTHLGLGTGGFSRIGVARGDGTAERVVTAALDHGINTIDTAEYYGTEPAVGAVLRRRPRDSFLVFTKYGPYVEGRLRTAVELEQALDDSLRNLNVECIDVFMMHAVLPEQYRAVRDAHLPVLESLRAKGKLRCIGITEMFTRDTSHETLAEAVQDDLFDVMMVGYNILNQTAARSIIPITRRKQIATIGMFAVRKALISEIHLREYIAEHRRQLPASDEVIDHLFAVMHDELGEVDLADVAYRFARDTGGLDIVLSGTSSVEHLVANIESIEKPPLPGRLISVLADTFSELSSLSGQ